MGGYHRADIRAAHQPLVRSVRFRLFQPCRLDNDRVISRPRQLALVTGGALAVPDLAQAAAGSGNCRRSLTSVCHGRLWISDWLRYGSLLGLLEAGGLKNLAKFSITARAVQIPSPISETRAASSVLSTRWPWAAQPVTDLNGISSDTRQRRRHNRARCRGGGVCGHLAAGDCSDCHTVRGGKAFAGGLPVPTPFGTIYSSNITPDPETGIGRWPEAAFRRAMRSGVDRDGRHLYPTFPYDHFTNVSEDDDRALYAYLMTRPPVHAPARANQLPFPL